MREGEREGGEGGEGEREGGEWEGGGRGCRPPHCDV